MRTALLHASAFYVCLQFASCERRNNDVIWVQQQQQNYKNSLMAWTALNEIRSLMLLVVYKTKMG